MNAEQYINKYVDDMEMIQQNLIIFLNDEDEVELKFHILQNKIDDLQIHDDEYKVKLLFHLILKISENYHRTSDFFDKIERVLLLFEDDMNKYFKDDNELFDLFKSSKRLLFFFFEKNIININKKIADEIINKYINANYREYFYKEWVDGIRKKFPNRRFNGKRRIGEDDSNICKCIRNDSIEEFKTYKLHNAIFCKSIYETNNFLLEKKVICIEYAVFYGARQIIEYLKNTLKLNFDQSLWIWAVHSRDEKMINFLYQKNILTMENQIKTTEEMLKESIKCHHNNLYNILSNYCNYIAKEDILINGFNYFNFFVIKQYDHDDDLKSLRFKLALFNAIEIGNIPLIQILLNDNSVCPNSLKIQILFFS